MNKRYDQFASQAPTGSRLILHADDTTGELKKTTIQDVLNLSTSQDELISVYQALGSQIKCYSAGLNNQICQAIASMTNNNIRYMAVWLPSDATLTGVCFLQGVQGAYTANNNNKIGLYTYSGGTITRVAQSNNNGNLWKSANHSVVKEPFSATYAATKGLYFIAALFNASAVSTTPSIQSTPFLINTNQSTFDFTNSAKLQSLVAGKSDLDSSIASSGLTAQQQHMWFSLY